MKDAAGLADLQHQEAMADKEADDIEVKLIADEWWTETDSIMGALDDKPIPRDLMLHAMTLRQLLKCDYGRPEPSRAVLEGTCIMLLDSLEELVEQYIREHELPARRW